MYSKRLLIKVNTSSRTLFVVSISHCFSHYQVVVLVVTVVVVLLLLPLLPLTLPCKSQKGKPLYILPYATRKSSRFTLNVYIIRKYNKKHKPPKYIMVKERSQTANEPTNQRWKDKQEKKNENSLSSLLRERVTLLPNLQKKYK